MSCSVKVNHNPSIMYDAVKLIIRRLGLLWIAVFISASIYGQSFRISYSTSADGYSEEESLAAIVEYEITEPENHRVSIIGCSGYFSNLKLPGKVEYDNMDYWVTEIGMEAFKNVGGEQYGFDWKRSSLTLPDNITIIGDFAFENAEFDIYLGNGVKEIGEGAFKGCKALKIGQLPECLEAIGKEAFRHSGLGGVVKIPKSVVELGDGVFAECEDLEGFSIDSDNQTFSVDEGVLYDKNGLHLIQYPAGKTDDSYSVPSHVIDVGEAGFAGNRYLKSVFFSNNHTSLSSGVFYNCTALESVVLPDGLDIIADGLFYNCSSLKEVCIPKGVMVMENHCFWGCDNLQKIISFPQVPPMMEDEVFSSDDMMICTHYSCLDLYRLADQWSAFSTFLPISELSVDEMSVYPLGSRQLDIILETSQLGILSFDKIDFTLNLPVGFALAKNSESDFVWGIPDDNPNEGLNVDISVKGESSYHFVIAGDDGNGIVSGHYPLLSLSLCSTFLEQDVSLCATIENVQLQSSDDKMTLLPPSEFIIMFEDILKGDVNYDGKQNVVDVMSIVSHILDNNVDIPLDVADVNQDSAIDVVDVMKLVQIILTNE